MRIPSVSRPAVRLRAYVVDVEVLERDDHLAAVAGFNVATVVDLGDGSELVV